MTDKKLDPQRRVTMTGPIWIFVAVAAVLLFLLYSMSHPQKAHAQQATVFGSGRLGSQRVLQIGTVTAGQTFATTSYADLAGTSLTYVPARDPTVAFRPQGAVSPVWIKAEISLDVVKATTLTGTCALYVNGAVVAATARTVSVAALNTTIHETYYAPITAATSQTVKWQCKSADTAVFTVNFGQATYTELV